MSDSGFHIGSDLTRIFDTARKFPPAETLEQIRQNYFIAATMSGDDSPSIAGLNINMSGRQDFTTLNTDRKKQQSNHTAFLLMISNMTIEQMENRLAAQYGENFAENLAAEYLDEDVYKRLMSIEDKTERRRQIALELNKGIRDGSIDADKINDNSDFKNWLDTHEKNRQLKLESTQNNQASLTETDSDPEHATDLTDINNKIEEAHTLSPGNEEAAFNAIFSGKGPTVK